MTEVIEFSDAPSVAPFGPLLAAHRRNRGFSQIALALEADVSARHLSFLEIGRSRPSVDMVRRLAGVLALTRVERNALLLAAGFAPETAYFQRGMHRREGAAAFATAMALGTVERPSEAVAVAADGLAELGVEHFITGVIHRTSTGYRIERDPVGRPAVGWLRYMQLRDYHDRDYLPAAAYARTRGFLWDEVRDEAMSPGQRRILEEARDFRIETGFVMPVHQPDGSVRALSAWAERIEDARATRTALSFIALALLETLDRLDVKRGPRRPDKLTAEHREALLRISEGAAGPGSTLKSAGPADDLVAQAAAVMGMRCPIAAAGRAAALGLLD